VPGAGVAAAAAVVGIALQVTTGVATNFEPCLWAGRVGQQEISA